MGHLNEAQKFGLMRQIGVELEFSNACVLLGDKVVKQSHCHTVCEQRRRHETNV